MAERAQFRLLLDRVIPQHDLHMLTVLGLATAGATLFSAAISFTLSQILGVAAALGSTSETLTVVQGNPGQMLDREHGSCFQVRVPSA